MNKKERWAARASAPLAHAAGRLYGHAATSSSARRFHTPPLRGPPLALPASIVGRVM